jgi:hypothetical protein
MKNFYHGGDVINFIANGLQFAPEIRLNAVSVFLQLILRLAHVANVHANAPLQNLHFDNTVVGTLICDCLSSGIGTLTQCDSVITAGSEQANALLRVLLLFAICGMRISPRFECLLVDVAALPAMKAFMQQYPPRWDLDKAFNNVFQCTLQSIDVRTMKVSITQPICNRGSAFLTTVMQSLNLANFPASERMLRVAMGAEVEVKPTANVFEFIWHVIMGIFIVLAEFLFLVRYQPFTIPVSWEMLHSCRVGMWQVLNYCEEHGYPFFAGYKTTLTRRITQTNTTRPAPLRHPWMVLCVIFATTLITTAKFSCHYKYATKPAFRPRVYVSYTRPMQADSGSYTRPMQADSGSYTHPMQADSGLYATEAEEEWVSVIYGESSADFDPAVSHAQTFQGNITF